MTENFTVTARSLCDHFTTLMKKLSREVKGTGPGDEELSKNEQFLEDLIKRFEESERRTEADT